MNPIATELVRDQVAAAVEEAVTRTPVSDIHTHLYDPAFGSLLLWGIDDLLTYHYLVAESFRWGMLAYEIPLKLHPETYNKQPLMYLALAAQKNNFALYLTIIASDKVLMGKLAAHYKAIGKKLDMGKGCLRFKTLEELPLALVGEMVASTPVERRIALFDEGRKAKK